MRRIIAACLALVMMVLPWMAYGEAGQGDDAPYMLFGIPFGTPITEAKEQLESELGVPFVEDVRKSTTRLVPEENVEIYGYNSYITVYFDNEKLEYFSATVNLFGEESGVYIFHRELKKDEEYNARIEDSVNGLKALYEKFENEYDAPTGGRLSIMEDDNSFTGYNYPLKDGTLDFELLKEMAKEGLVLFCVPNWGNIQLSFEVNTSMPSFGKQYYSVSAGARITNHWTIDGRLYEPKVGFDGEDGDYPLNR